MGTEPNPRLTEIRLKFVENNLRDKYNPLMQIVNKTINIRATSNISNFSMMINKN